MPPPRPVRPHSTAAELWTGFACELGRRPELIENVLREHTPTGDALCRACSSPGYGVPHQEWPCAFYSLATEALAIACRSRSR